MQQRRRSVTVCRMYLCRLKIDDRIARKLPTFANKDSVLKTWFDGCNQAICWTLTTLALGLQLASFSYTQHNFWASLPLRNNVIVDMTKHISFSSWTPVEPMEPPDRPSKRPRPAICSEVMYFFRFRKDQLDWPKQRKPRKPPHSLSMLSERTAATQRSQTPASVT